METEFVCIPHPVDPRGGAGRRPLVYRGRHRVPFWQAGRPAWLIQEVVEGDARFSI